MASVSHYISLSERTLLTPLSVTDYFTDENIKFKVETKNYNDQILKKSYTAKLSKLSPQERVFRTNFESEIQNALSLAKKFLYKNSLMIILKNLKKEQKVIFEKNI